jgi:hypothetical protein
MSESSTKNAASNFEIQYSSLPEVLGYERNFFQPLVTMDVSRCTEHFTGMRRGLPKAQYVKENFI